MTGFNHFGKPTSRVEGRAKVTGVAKFAAEYNVPNLAHGVVVSSAIAKGRIARIHTEDALAVEGVLDVFTHAHRPKMAAAPTRLHRPASRSARFMTRRSISAGSRWRWSSPRSSKSRASQRH
jgi:CO/xanthine dehydrogenase Mo-binding subunit